MGTAALTFLAIVVGLVILIVALILAPLKLYSIHRELVTIRAIATRQATLADKQIEHLEYNSKCLEFLTRAAEEQVRLLGQANAPPETR